MALFKYKLDTVNNYYAFLNEVTGDDANDGLTPETAVASMNRLVTILNTYAGALRRVGVIYAHRIYDQAITVTRTSTKPITFDFVNRTLLDNTGASSIFFRVYGDIIQNCVIIGNPTVALNAIPSTGSELIATYNDCELTTCAFIGASGSTLAARVVFNKCVINNINSNSAGSNIYLAPQYLNCVMIGNNRHNYRTQMTMVLKNTILFNSTLTFYSAAPTWPVLNFSIDFSNIFNSTIGGKTESELKSLGYNLNGLSINPQFNDPTNGVYTVRSTSPMLYRGENGQHIGIGEAIYVSATELFSLGETIDNLTLQSGKLIRPDDSSDALLETYMMSLGATRSIERIALVAALAYATSGITRSVAIDTEGYIAYDSGTTYHTGSSITDSSIKYKSIADNNTGNTPATSPLYWERMTWESGVSYASGKIIQYTDNKWYRANAATSTTWVAGEWDLIVPVDTLSFGLKYGRTNSEAEAMDWEMFNFNQELLVDASGNGTANNDYDPDTGASIRINYWKVRIMVKTVR